MRRRLLLVFLLCTSPLFAAVQTAPTREAAWQAQRLLGPEVWSRVLRIENSNPASPFPPIVYATVFEMGGILWFYTGMDGTRSFSRHIGRLEAEKTEFAQLLRHVDPGFTAYATLPEAMVTFAKRTGALPMGCVIDSWLALRDLVERGVPVLRARLLTVYLQQGGGLAGHTVLAYETVLGVHMIDRAVSPAPRQVDGDLHDERGIARQLLPPHLHHRLVRAQWFDVMIPEKAADPAYVQAETRQAAGATG